MTTAEVQMFDVGLKEILNFHLQSKIPCYKPSTPRSHPITIEAFTQSNKVSNQIQYRNKYDREQVRR